jgi:aryl-phospho-beta-D-glucosidase BglC (GH1 family)
MQGSFARALRHGWSTAACLLVTSCAAARPAAPATSPDGREPVSAGAVSPDQNPFVHAVGRNLVDGQGRRVLLEGIAFGNRVWLDPAVPESLHSEADYRRIRALGMNSVRFYLNHRWFEGRTQGTWDERGFAWLARNVAWARANEIGLVLNVHVPPGGFQSNGGGRALWTDERNQRRFVALWREIARRFADEPAVIGYDLLNEPVVTESIAQWERLARRTVAAIREVDRRHLLVVERVNAIYPGGFLRRPRATDWAPDRNGAFNFFRVDDGNVMYEFHYYQPIAFTHQGATWIPMDVPTAASYPGSFVDWDGVARTFDRAYHERMLSRLLEVQAQLDAPMYLGELGVIRAGFESGKNGAGWVRDVLQLTLGAGIGVSYHSYESKDDLFGVSENEAAWSALAAAYREF